MGTPVDELDAELHRSDAFWNQMGEEEVVYAVSLVERFGPDDWPRLDAIWRERPVAWQCCLATILSEVGPAPAVPWLIEMIEHGEEELAMHAIDELHAMSRARSLALRWPPTTIARVRVLWRRHRGFTDKTVEDFLDDMAQGRW